jgi:hypothetical protein
MNQYSYVDANNCLIKKKTTTTTQYKDDKGVVMSEEVVTVVVDYTYTSSKLPSYILAKAHYDSIFQNHNPDVAKSGENVNG